MTHYFNEFDTYAAAWLRELMKGGLVPEGTVDERSIKEVQPADLAGFRQCHFFAGISGWTEALRLAGWPQGREVWTGSCPCQPYSSAGKQQGNADDRNLWPDFFRLIRECRPETVFGEQVASADVVGTGDEAAFIAAVQAGDNRQANRLAERIAKAKRNRTTSPDELTQRWVDGVCTDLANEGYAVWFDVHGAHSVGAPHIRQRLYWVAHAKRPQRRAVGERDDEACGRQQEATELRGGGTPCGVADAKCERDGDHRSGEAGATSPGVQGEDGERQRVRSNARKCRRVVFEFDERCLESLDKLRVQGRIGDDVLRVAGIINNARGMGDPDGSGCTQQRRAVANQSEQPAAECAGTFSGWRDSRIILCTDGKSRRIPTQPGLFPLAPGVSGRVAVARPSEQAESANPEIRWANRVGALRGAGNAICVYTAAAFIKAFIEATRDVT